MGAGPSGSTRGGSGTPQSEAGEFCIRSRRRYESLVLFLTNFLTVTLASERFFDALFLAWFQIEGVTLDLFDDVFGLNFTFEAAQGVLERFTFLNANLCQGEYTSQSGLIG